MAIYKRGDIWWYEFVFQGQRIRESTNTSNKEIAGRAERERRRALELGASGLTEKKQPQLFSVAAKRWLETNSAHWSASNTRIEKYNVEHLLPHFGKLLLTDVSADSISRYQAKRKKDEASNRTINMEVGTLRAIMRKHRLWANIQPDVRMLKARQDIGRALSEDEQHRLLTACKKSRSRSLYPAVLLSLHTGLRNGELRLLRWRQIDLIERTLEVGKSKTVGGEGRLVPLSQAATLCLQEWRSQFPDVEPAHYVFPSERYGLDSFEDGQCLPYEIQPDKPIGSWKVAWTAARTTAKVSCRWHDMRHTFVSAMAEGQASDATIMALAGHLSRKMMEKYSHTRNEAKRAAIAILDQGKEKNPAGSPQNPPQ
ncbi:tyrosine-type recombinase/integrase [Silvibacterium sp.]|uniref:tyrosine-type recombinase/integrase n=1 Tax=Silvibacterium sp. TaxID=1964179 RepID=UPI0039E3647F